MAVAVPDLSARLAPLVGRSLEEVQVSLLAGPVVVQRELSYGEAIQFQRELGKRKIPAQVSQEIEGMEELLLQRAESEENSKAPKSLDSARERKKDVPQAQGGAGEEIFEEEVALRVPEKEEDEDEDAGAWADLFPDLLSSSDESTPKATALKKREELSLSAPLAASAPFEEPVDVNGFEGLESLDAGEVADFDDIDEFDDLDLDSFDNLEEGFPSPLLEPLNSKGAGANGALGAKTAQSFDGSKLREAFDSRDAARPPFKPKGFDKRPEHVPLVAAVLSAAAPGAGQIFNGQEEKGRGLGLRGLLLLPWIKGVRQAYEYGEKVRTYYAPRPPEGALRRAISYAVKWWLAVIALLVVGFWSATSLIEYSEAQKDRERRVAFQQLLFISQDIVDDALDEAEDAAKNVELVAADERDPRFSMDKEERARRLYIIGYHYCVVGEYQMCEAAMKRVTSLVRSNRDAFRLQAWASIQAQEPHNASEMPEVAPVSTLEEFELELSLSGEDLEFATEDDIWDDGMRLQDGVGNE